LAEDDTASVSLLGSMLYWTEVNGTGSRVMRCRLNGTDVTQITSTIDSPNGLYIDLQAVSLYVLQGLNGLLYQCDLTLSTGQLLVTFSFVVSICYNYE